MRASIVGPWVAALVACSACGSGTAAGGRPANDGGLASDAGALRDPLHWPFSTTSIWNTPIGSGAVYVPAQITQATAAGMTVDQDLIVMRPAAPSLAVMTNTADWDNTKDRCPPSAPEQPGRSFTGVRGHR